VLRSNCSPPEVRHAFWRRLRHGCDDALARGHAFVLILGHSGHLADPDLLSAAEYRRMACLRRQADRDNLALGRTMIQQLAVPAGIPVPAPLLTGAQGKPYIAGAHPFNLAHSGHYVACAVCATHPIGIDIELFDRAAPDPALVALIAHPNERRQIDALTGPRRARLFQQCWTRKEALLKQQGLGLTETLPAIDVRLTSPCPLVQGEHGARLYDLDLPAPDLRGALALDSAVHRVSLLFYDAAGVETAYLIPA